jgi:hypothetical protein
MKEQNSSFIKMIISVSKYLKSSNVLSAIPAIVALQVKLDKKIPDLVRLSELISTEDKSVAISVSATTEKVTSQLFAVIKALEIYFMKQKDLATVTKLHMNRTEIKRATYKTIEASVKSAVKIARDNLSSLAIYNITEEQLATIEANMLELTTTNSALDAFQENKKEKREELEAHIDDCKELLNEIDMVVEIISLAQPDTYKGYQEVRNKKAYTELFLTITVLNSETGKPEENARVLVQSTTRTEKGKPYVLIDRKTKKTGEVRNRKREFDIYNVTVEKLGCETYTQEFTLADNTPMRMQVVLKKIEGLN